MCMRSISRTCKHYSHPKLGVLCDTLMRNWCETWLFWPKIAWRVGACSDENCKIETQGLQIHVDGRKPSHQVQINFHILLCWVWSLALPWTFWPWDFSDPELSCPWRSKWLLTQWGEPVGGKPLGLEQPTEQICSSTGLMCCINWFWGLMQKLGFVLGTSCTLAGNTFEKSKLVHVLLWNKWELCHWQHSIGFFCVPYIFTYIWMQVTCSGESWWCFFL